MSSAKLAREARIERANGRVQKANGNIMLLCAAALEGNPDAVEIAEVINVLRVEGHIIIADSAEYFARGRDLEAQAKAAKRLEGSK